MDENLPETQPSGSLVPPPRVPPVGVAASAPVPPRPPSSRGGWSTEMSLRSLAASALDRLDMIGDRIASVVGLR
jgi:hypothetical protein